MIRFKGTLILGLAAVALLIVVLLVGKPEQHKPSRTAPIFEVNDAKIDRITLTVGREVISATRGDRRWTLVQPVEGPANRERWNEMASALANLDVERVVEKTDVRPEAFGLARPALVVTFQETGGAMHKLAFGDENPAGDAVYAQRENDPRVFLLARSVRDAFVTDLNRLRATTILDFSPLAPDRIELNRPAGRLVLKKADGDWTMSAPVAARADDKAVNDWLRRLSQAPIADHLDSLSPERRQAAFGTIRYHLTLHQPQGESLMLDVDGNGPAGTGIMAHNLERGDYFSVAPTVVHDLDISADALRSHSLAAFDPYAVTGITVVHHDRKTMLSRNPDGTWRMKTGTGSIELATEPILNFIDALDKVQVNRFVDHPGDASAYGLELPAVNLILDLDGSTGLTLQFGEPRNQTTYVRNPKYPSLMAVPASTWSRLGFQPGDWHKKGH